MGNVWWVFLNSWIELILMCFFFPQIHLVSEGNWHVNNLNCRVQFEFLSLNVISVFMSISFYANRKSVASHVDNNSSVVFTLLSTVVQFLPRKLLYPTGYLKRTCFPCLQENMKVTLYFLFLYILTKHKPLLISDFQNYLRTQMGNTTTVNIIISTVDYLLRLQVRKNQQNGVQHIRLSFIFINSHFTGIKCENPLFRAT